MSAVSRPMVNVALACILALSACADRDVTLPRQPESSSIRNVAPEPMLPGEATIRIVIPARKRGDRDHYVSASTKSIAIAMTPASGGKTTRYNADLTPSTNRNCVANLSGGYACMIELPVAPGKYVASFATYDGLLSRKHAPTGRVLSMNQSVPMDIRRSRKNMIGVTLGGVPASVVIVPTAGSSMKGDMVDGFTMGKCGSTSPTSETVSVMGVDAGGNDILGPGAPTSSLESSNASLLAVSTPPSSPPNVFTLTHSISNKSQGPTTLTASVKPLPVAGGPAVAASTPVMIAGGAQICGAFTFSNLLPGAGPIGIAVGPDGNLWFTELNANKIGRITTAGVVTEFSTGLSSGILQLTGIAAGPDGNLWFTEAFGNRVGKITTNGAITEFPIPAEYNQPMGIAAGPDGNMWFAEPSTAGNFGIARMTTTGSITEFSTGTLDQPGEPTGFGAWYLAVDSDGALWFTALFQQGGQHLLAGRITTSGAITTYRPQQADLYSAGGIALGPDGNMWLAAGNLGRVTPTGTIAAFPLSVGGQSESFAAGPDGAMWFTQNTGADGVDLVRITTDGVVGPALRSDDNYAQSTYSGGLVAGPDGAL